MEYHKIVTVWKRDPGNKYKTLISNEWATPEFEYLQNLAWQWTEKVDGTNIRVMWDGENVRFGGKTDRAQMPAFLLDVLFDRFQPDVFATMFDGPVVLYGEGYGAKIQKGGGNYISTGCDFILFDVWCGDLWLKRPDVCDIGEKLGVEVVPLVGTGPLQEAVRVAARGFESLVAEAVVQAEGLVMRPKVELLDRRGQRVITKIKAKDFGGK